MGNSTCCAKQQAENQAANIIELPLNDVGCELNAIDSATMSEKVHQDVQNSAETNIQVKKLDGTIKKDGSCKEESTEAPTEVVIDAAAVNLSETLETIMLECVIKRRGDSDLLGMDVKHMKGSLKIMHIFSGGAVERSNAESKTKNPPGDTLQVDDLITEVNDIQGDDVGMVAQFQSSLEIRVKAKREIQQPI